MASSGVLAFAAAVASSLVGSAESRTSDLSPALAGEISPSRSSTTPVPLTTEDEYAAYQSESSQPVSQGEVWVSGDAGGLLFQTGFRRMVGVGGGVQVGYGRQAVGIGAELRYGSYQYEYAYRESLYVEAEMVRRSIPALDLVIQTRVPFAETDGANGLATSVGGLLGVGGGYRFGEGPRSSFNRSLLGIVEGGLYGRMALRSGLTVSVDGLARVSAAAYAPDLTLTEGEVTTTSSDKARTVLVRPGLRLSLGAMF